MTVYNVFPGIELIYNEFETTEFSWKNNTSGNVMEINRFILIVFVGAKVGKITSTYVFPYEFLTCSVYSCG